MMISRNKSLRSSLLLTAAAILLSGCLSDSTSNDESENSQLEERGKLGKADLYGSCNVMEDDGLSEKDYCGGKSYGTCWCDDLCEGYGDCCADYQASCQASSLPDLYVKTIRREAPYYYVEYCNGGGPSDDTFTVLLADYFSGEEFETNSYYPFQVPAPETCEWTGGITCGLIGDDTCTNTITVKAHADAAEQVAESDDYNNDAVWDFVSP